MSKSRKHGTPATPETTKELVVEASAATKKHESVVDEVFDAVTGWAAHGLIAAKRGLEASARWLDNTAKVVGELATKLESTSRSEGASGGSASATPAAAPSA